MNMNAKKMYSSPWYSSSIICKCNCECIHVCIEEVYICNKEPNNHLETTSPHSLKPRKRMTVENHILSSDQRLLSFKYASCSLFPWSASIPTPKPRSTHILLPISDRRDNALANANRSSSPLKIEVVLSACIDKPRSSIIMRIASERSAPSSLLPSVRVDLTSSAERKRLVRGTSVVRTNFACLIYFVSFTGMGRLF